MSPRYVRRTVDPELAHPSTSEVPGLKKSKDPEDTRKQARMVRLCRYTVSVSSKTNTTKLWAFSMKDLAKLYQITEGAVVRLVYGRDAAPGRKLVKPSLDPSYLDRVCDLREKKRWEACQGDTPLSTLRTYLAQHKPEYVKVLETNMDMSANHLLSDVADDLEGYTADHKIVLAPSRILEARAQVAGLRVLAKTLGSKP